MPEFRIENKTLLSWYEVRPQRFLIQGTNALGQIVADEERQDRDIGRELFRKGSPCQQRLRGAVAAYGEVQHLERFVGRIASASAAIQARLHQAPPGLLNRDLNGFGK
ncbi:hypothetical protein CKO40_14080 [Halochromatium glycolicum]|uniref:Uncharacterized protein n=1 Tax=Halochromatium glycolicum TaxID=85075 RepID=A0AAJ0U5G3_9GAMM|nr:hypothetical protein [Halochromatium glycolicum]